MPRRNIGRSLGSERDLARRIKYERSEVRDLSYRALADLMTEAGCPIQPSAILRIEQDENPRRISVDELVAFAKVFDVPDVGDLLLPLELMQKEEAKQLAADFTEAAEQLEAATFTLFGVLLQYFDLAVSDPDLHEFARNQIGALGLKAQVPAALLPDDLDTSVLEPLTDALRGHLETIMSEARDVVAQYRSVEFNKGDS